MTVLLFVARGQGRQIGDGSLEGEPEKGDRWWCQTHHRLRTVRPHDRKH